MLGAKMKTYNVIFRKDKISNDIANTICERLGNQRRDLNNPHTVFVVGGDGTFLTAVHQYIDQLNTCEFVAIHTGTLGFFTDFRAQEIEECITCFLDSEPIIQTMPLLLTNINGSSYYAVNEMRIENVFKTQLIDVYINDHFLETFRGTGLCVSTQLGSTAYNRSLKGAIIADGLNLIQLTEITGIHHREFRSLDSSLVLPADTKITLIGNDFDQAVMCYDHKTVQVAGNLKIDCQLADKMIRFARYKQISYFDRLKSLF